MFDTRIVGILNITPDSFSDGGKYLAADAAVAHVRTLADEGADVIDIGAESTRPDSTPLAHEDEWQRLEPVIAALGEFPAMPFSIDTRHAQTATKALASGHIGCINDVSGFKDSAMVEAVKDYDCKLVLMHSLTVPADKNVVMDGAQDVVEALLAFARERISALADAGIGRERIIFDPGIGFGKTAEQSMAIMRDVRRFKALGVSVYIGHSRKSFLGAGDRDAATLSWSSSLIEQGVDYIRVHDVAAHRRLLDGMRRGHE